ncbi:Hypothetical_protein [Hexamita inflata]|uniref:Hypothetical_protein n=1 Tax=Hexamita inflata TaxID=28002 RepID=A0AA86PLA6_9EUKA|nr:Hypothetical protein HINF_LOCUS24939 [Hexamita inflata]
MSIPLLEQKSQSFVFQTELDSPFQQQNTEQSSTFAHEFKQNHLRTINDPKNELSQVQTSENKPTTAGIVIDKLQIEPTMSLESQSELDLNTKNMQQEQLFQITTHFKTKTSAFNEQKWYQNQTPMPNIQQILRQKVDIERKQPPQILGKAEKRFDTKVINGKIEIPEHILQKSHFDEEMMHNQEIRQDIQLVRKDMETIFKLQAKSIAEQSPTLNTAQTTKNTKNKPIPLKQQSQK